MLSNHIVIGLFPIKPAKESVMKQLSFEFIEEINNEVYIELSIEIANKKNRFVSINYLNSPGFTDTPGELDALLAILKKYKIHMIQWRNLNYDPLLYYETMKAVSEFSDPIGMGKMLTILKEEFPDLIHGYFNPPKEKFLKIKDIFL